MWKLIIIIFIIFNIIAFVIPKNINKIEIYATCFFAFSYGLITDIILDLHYHLYGYIHKGFDWGGLLSTFLYFPSISYLFLNFFPFKKRLLRKIYYVLGWSIFSIIFEWFTLKTGFFTILNGKSGIQVYYIHSYFHHLFSIWNSLKGLTNNFIVKVAKKAGVTYTLTVKINHFTSK